MKIKKHKRKVLKNIVFKCCPIMKMFFPSVTHLQYIRCDKQVIIVQTKIIKNSIIYSILAIFLVTYAVPQPVMYAAEQTSQKTEKVKQNPAKIKRNLKELAINIMNIDAYATTIKNEPNPPLTNIKSVPNELKSDIQRNFTNAKWNANQWSNSLKPSMNTFLDRIVDFNDAYQKIQSKLLSVLKEENKQKIKSEIEYLNDIILVQKRNADMLVNKLIQFRNNITKDTQRFQNNTNQLEVHAITSSTADIPLLKRKINYYNNVIDDTDYRIAAGSVACATLVGCIWGGFEIDSAKREKRDAEYQIRKLKAKIQGIEKDIATITNVQNKLSNMVHKVDKAIDSLQNLTNYWHLLSSKYDNLLNDVDILSANELNLLREDLQIASASWEQIKQFAKSLSQALK
ncbi:hypothetical protein CAI16_04085 [Virgibacillus dokdonensis]|uniref:Hemolysin BL-binding component n=1 Tax=Virgibacillus dokdonensis TaxID=302167 RepID=A0A3E0WX46_9BACI|nr:HBL/NHE enterotoxin family protein [Virgibacillus dokdonensis]RFA36575.1 hypothetical protein CAI16_04085 [Virgibacillus dokdonensis]